MMNESNLSIILPAKNEAKGLSQILPVLQELYKDAEILVINDGSTDDTVQICEKYAVRIHTLPYSGGNGAAVKTGARIARGDILVFMDADGQHDPGDIKQLIGLLDQGYDMAVGSRVYSEHASTTRFLGNNIYNKLASWMVNKKIADLTSGFRAVRADQFREFLFILPNGFSYPTSITMAFFRAGYTVGYTPIKTGARHGRSHLRLIKDGVRFFLIIFRVATLYSPLKVFLPASLGFFIIGLTYYLYTYISIGRFTNMSALLFITSVLIFLIGLISEQITSLLYQRNK